MKRVILFLLLAGAFTACKNDATDTAAEGEEASVTETRPITPPEGGPITGANRTPSMQTEKLIGFLTTGYWYMEVYVKINDPEASTANRGRWYKFAPDGTFTTGRYKGISAKGVWTYDPQTALIFIDSEKNDQDGEWKIQMGKTGTVMILVGTERFAQNSIQIKLENYVELMAELPPISN